MRRFLILSLFLFMAIGSAYAQSTDAQKKIHMAAERICAKIDVDKAHKDHIHLSIIQERYEQFRTILRPSQIQKMYDIEREWGRP